KDKKFLDKMIEEFDIYNIHLINALFLLERYRRGNGGNEIVDFSKALLIEYMSEENKNLRKHWTIYKSIRKIAYVLMDSHYAPIPFKLDSASIMLNLGHYHEELINNESAFHKALDQTNGVLESSLYLEPNSMLITSSRINQIHRNLINNFPNQQLNKVS